MLHQLSGLRADQLTDFLVDWAGLSHQSKSEILSSLIELSEKDVRLEFSSVFLSCLEDDSENVRELAVMGLWDCEDRAIIPPLINLLFRDCASNVKAAVAETLGTFSAMAQSTDLARMPLPLKSLTVQKVQ